MKQEPRQKFTMFAQGASVEARRRGIDAALKVFKKHAISPNDAALARFALEAEDGPLNRFDEKYCQVWYQAEKAAIEACFGWRDPVGEAYIQVFNKHIHEDLRPGEEARLRANGLGDQLWYLDQEEVTVDVPLYGPNRNRVFV